MVQTTTQPSTAQPFASSAGQPAEPPSSDADADSIELADRFAETVRRLRRGTADALAPLGLSGSQARVVRLLAGGPLRMTAIADRLSVVPRSVTDMVDAVERAGLVVRLADPDDRRSTLVELTPAGRLLIDRLDVARRLSAARVFGGLDPAQRADLLRLLRALSDGGCDR